MLAYKATVSVFYRKTIIFISKHAFRKETE